MLLELYVEGPTDKSVVNIFLKKAGFPIGRVKVFVCGSKRKIAKIVAQKANSDKKKYAALIDLDANTVKDAGILAKTQLGNPPIAVFSAVPTIEAWLLADPDAFGQLAGEEKREFVSRLPLPEQIPYPKIVLSHLLGRAHGCELLAEKIDLKRAQKRAPSLRVFLEGVASILDIPFDPPSRSYSESINRNVFSNLMSEVVPSSTVIFRALDGTTVTAGEMLVHIRDGNEIGMQYCSDVLRIARDLMMRKAQE